MCYGSNVSVKVRTTLIRVEGRTVLSCHMAEGNPQFKEWVLLYGAVTYRESVAFFFTHLGSLVYFFYRLLSWILYLINPNDYSVMTLTFGFCS